MADAIEDFEVSSLFCEDARIMDEIPKLERIANKRSISSPSKSSDNSSDRLIVLDSVESGCEDSNSVRMEMNRESKEGNSAFTEELEKELQVLKEENVQLRNQINNLMSEKESSQNSPVVQITFRDSNLAKKYRTEVEKFLKILLSKEKNVVIHIDEKEGSRLQFFQDFCVDNLSSNSSESKKSKEETWDVPVYDQHYVEDAEKDQLKEAEKEQPDAAKLVTCFNCLGNHTVDKCPEKVDRKRVNQNRQKFVANKSNRYHEESEQNSKFTPGIISNELRRALDLRDYQIPRHVYSMRILGYPPGWLKYAEIESSGLTLYDTEGNAIEDIGEDGEIEVNSTRVQYDPKKLMDFPGFNVRLPHGFVDEHKLLNMPSMQLHHLRSEAEKHMKAPEASPYRKRKLDSKSDAKHKFEKLEHEDHDMDVDRTDGCGVTRPDRDNTSKYTSSLSANSKHHSDNDNTTPSQLKKDSSQTSPRPSSPSLSDLEQAKQQLMQQLEKMSDANAKCDEQNVLTTDSKSSKQSSSETEMISEDSQSSDGVRKIHHVKYSTSLSVHPGTPVITRHSNYDILPDSSKFSTGVSEHIPFENLPTSTGTYEKMKGVLGRVRRRIQDLQ